MLTPAYPSFVAAELILAGARVKFAAGSVNRVVNADAGDAEIGTAILYGGKSSYAAESAVGINLIHNPGGRTLRASGAIDASAGPVAIYRAAGGAVSASVSGEAVGLAIESAGDGDFFEGLIVPSLASAVIGSQDGLSSLRTARATFDPSGVAGHRTIAAHGLGVTLPIKAIVLRAYWDVVTTFTSATDAATIALKAESAGDLMAALAISDTRNRWDAGIHAGTPGFPNFGADAAHDTQPEVAALFAATAIKLTAARELTATVAVEALTGGKAVLFVDYVIGG
jgi:hypothetical protein